MAYTWQGWKPHENLRDYAGLIYKKIIEYILGIWGWPYLCLGGDEMGHLLGFRILEEGIVT